MMRRAAWALMWLLLIPASVVAQEEATAVVEHRVQPGETLWSIASVYYSDPYQWRQILEANEDRIADPRYLEPGQTLLIPSGVAGRDQPATVAEVQGIQVTTVPRRFGSVPVSPAEPRSDRTIFYSGGGGQRPGVLRTTPSATPAPETTRFEYETVPLTAVPPDVFYTAGWLVPVDSEPASIGTIGDFAASDGGRIFDRTTAYPFDNLRLDLNDGPALKAGDQLMTYRLGREIEYVGQVVLPTGIITVIRSEPSGVIAVLAEEYGQVALGDRVLPLPDYPITTGVSAEPATNDQVGHILAFQDSHLLQSLGSIAYLDFGSESGVRVGDEFVVHVGEQEGWQGDEIGRLQVVGVHEDHTVARIVHVSAPLFVAGLEVRLAAKMP